MNFESLSCRANYAEFIFFSESIIYPIGKENFYPEKLKKKGARGGLLRKNRKGKNDRFRNHNEHVNPQTAA